MIRSTRSGSSLFIVQLKTKNVRSYQNCSSTEQTCFEEGHVGNVKSLYERWLNDPNDVGPAWDSFFKTVSQQEKCKSKSPGLSYSDRNVSIGKRPYHDKYDFEYFKKEEDQITDIDQVILVHRLIRSYQVRGHHLAKLDPLDQHRVERLPLFGRGKEALYRHYADEHVNLLRKVQYELNLDKTYPLPVSTTHIGGEEGTSLKLSEIIARLEKVYCDRIGLEYMHISSFSQCDYIRKRFETPNAFRITTEEKILLLSRLARAIGFEEFCDHYYPQAVRYSLEGCESLIPCIKAIIDHSTEVGVDHFIFGMAHRGRMNVLTNIFRIPLTQIMPLFHRSEPERPGLGEAPFYLGADVVKRNRMTNKTTRLTMLATPAHVESVNAVALGRTKIEQMMRSKRSKVIPILIHGDMAFSGQGISYEILNLSDLPAFNTRGTIHIILNNQLASGSDVQTMRSQAYSTDLGKIINAPIFHVNADDPEAVRHVSMVAAKWRSVFKMDCIVELVAYRRYGQSTQDDRTITDPALSAKIEKTPNVYEKYVEQLRNENAIAEEEARSKRSTGPETAKKGELIKTAGRKREGGKKNKNDEIGGESEEASIIKEEYREVLDEIEKAEKERQERRKMRKIMNEMRKMERIKLAEKLIRKKRAKKKPKKE